MVSLYVERLSIGCERVIGRSHLQVSKVRRDDDAQRRVQSLGSEQTSGSIQAQY